MASKTEKKKVAAAADAPAPRERLPSPEIRNEIIAKLSSLIRSLESHNRWTPPNPHRSLLNIWDFVQRTRYIMSELDNIEAGRPLQYPEQIPDLLGAAKTGTAAALECFTDVYTRSLNVDLLLSDPVRQRMMGMEPIDFGAEIKAIAKEIPKYIETH